jgi:hypothetical protein
LISPGNPGYTTSFLGMDDQLIIFQITSETIPKTGRRIDSDINDYIVLFFVESAIPAF